MASMSGTAVERPRSAAVETLDRIRGRLVRPLPADGWWGWAIPLAITGVALFMRLWRITRPPAKVFDETYYAPDAWNLLHHGVELDTNSPTTAPGFVAHPPLGKWAIAVGEGIFGNHPLGWRFSSAIVGSLAILMLARIARRLFRSTLLGCIAGLLLAFDGLEFVQSRTSMLDIFLMFWVLAAFGCLLLDRDHGRRRLADALDRPLDLASRGPWLGFRPWRWAAGFCLGAACATKWDGIFWVPTFFLLALFWDAGARRIAGARQPLVSALLLDGLFALVPFVVLVAAVYLASWTGWFISDGAHAWNHDRYVHAGQSWFAHDRAVLGGWWRYQWEMYNFHRHLDAAHPYLSRPYGWLLLARPVSYFYASPHGCGTDSCSQEVLALGTPALWWAAIPALIAVLWRAIGRLDWRAAAIVIPFAAGYLPWFVADHDHRTMFLFYMLPVLPFMVLAVTMTLGMVLGRAYSTPLRHSVGTVAAGAYLLAVIATFGYLYPVLAGKVLTYDQWHNRMWFHTCDTSKNRNEHHENAPCWI
jgi:dolichyl-phosphate-mannose--protein O-mannosyl transferase